MPRARRARAPASFDDSGGRSPYFLTHFPREIGDRRRFLRHRADVFRLAGHAYVPMTADAEILPVKSFPRVIGQRRVGRNATMELVERSLAQHHDVVHA